MTAALVLMSQIKPGPVNAASKGGEQSLVQTADNVSLDHRMAHGLVSGTQGDPWVVASDT